MSADVSSFGLDHISQISVTVHDLDKAVEFYRNSLGMKLMFQASKMAFFECSGIRIMLAVPEDPEFDHPSSIIYYKVDDIQSAYETLTSRNVTFVGPPHLVARMEDREIWMAFFRDIDSNLLALTSEPPLE